jgi:hypothetical protein
MLKIRSLLKRKQSAGIKVSRLRMHKEASSRPIMVGVIGV